MLHNRSFTAARMVRMAKHNWEPGVSGCEAGAQQEATITASSDGKNAGCRVVHGSIAQEFLLLNMFLRSGCQDGLQVSQVNILTSQKTTWNIMFGPCQLRKIDVHKISCSKICEC
eukprot:evm.model.scf_22.4 EVM.evm.TU.scf_22.4   scf_22:55609-55953(+)